MLVGPLRLGRALLVGLAALLAWGAIACASSTPQNIAGAALEEPLPARRAIPRGVWVARVDIDDSDGPEVEGIEDAFTLSFVRYLQQWGGFSSVRALPGEAAREDWVLALRFDRYQLLLIPRSTFFWWPGMPLFDQVTELDGELEIRDADGQVLAEANELVYERRTLRGVELPNGSRQRTLFVEKVLAQALAQLPEGARRAP